MRPLLIVLLIASAARGEQLQQPLTLRQAMDLAVRNNLSVSLARSRAEGARAQVLEASAALLPAVLGSVSQSRVFKLNLAAQGFPPNSTLFNPLLGPFNVFDARVQLVQDLLNVSSIRRYQASRRGAALSELEEGLAREQVAAAAALAYVDAGRAEKAKEAARADLELASALQKLADDQHKAGVSAGIDVTRAGTRAAQAKLKLLQVEVAQRQAELRLARVTGIALGRSLRLSDELGLGAVELPEAEASVSSAQASRLEARIAEERVAADSYALGAAKGQALPVLSINGNYGSSGNLPDSAARATGSIGAALKMPLFTGGLIRGEVREAQSRKAQSESALEDTRAQIEEDVRLALEALGAAQDQVKTADQVVELAQRELKLARDRFAAGAAGNIELVNAQDSLAGARDAQVAALSQFHVARINFALAVGRMGDFHL